MKITVEKPRIGRTTIRKNPMHKKQLWVKCLECGCEGNDPGYILLGFCHNKKPTLGMRTVLVKRFEKQRE